MYVLKAKALATLCLNKYTYPQIDARGVRHVRTIQV